LEKVRVKEWFVFLLASWREGDSGAQKRVSCGSHSEDSIISHKLSVKAEDENNFDRERSTTVVEVSVEYRKSFKVDRRRA